MTRRRWPFVLSAIALAIGGLMAGFVHLQRGQERARIDALWNPCNMAKAAMARHERGEGMAGFTLSDWKREGERLYWAKMEACRAKGDVAVH